MGESQPAAEAVVLDPTTDRAGEEIGATVIECWACGATGAIRRDVALCGNCGNWGKIPQGQR